MPEKAACVVIVPPGLAPGSHFVVDLFDGSSIDVTVPPGKKPGDTLVIGTAATTYGIEGEESEATGNSGIVVSRIAHLGVLVPEGLPKGHDIYVGSPFGGVYAVHLPEGAIPGQKITVQVPVYTQDEPSPPSAAAAAPPALKKHATSNLSILLGKLQEEHDLIGLDFLLDELEDNLQLLDEEISRYFVAGMEEVDTVAMAIGSMQHVVVGKLVRHRTEKWVKLNREKSAWQDKRASATALKERPGRQHKRQGLFGGGLGMTKAWKSLRGLRAPSVKPPVKV